MKWKPTSLTKLYEALGAVADGRVHISGNTAKVYSSSGNKFYDISYDPEKNAIMSNDNTSFWKGELGYPAIAFLFAKGILEYKSEYGEMLKDIKWKDINQSFKNDFKKAVEYIEGTLGKKESDDLREYLKTIEKKIIELDFDMLGQKVKPPAGY